MKTTLLLLGLTVLMTFSSTAQTPQGAKAMTLRHVVLFSFKATSTPEDIKRVEDAFRALPAQIREIKGFEWGTNNSPEGLAQGFTHCFLVTFSSEEDRQIYLPHPAHQAFVEVLKPHMDKVLVIDYWTQK